MHSQRKTRMNFGYMGWNLYESWNLRLKIEMKPCVRTNCIDRVCFHSDNELFCLHFLEFNNFPANESFDHNNNQYLISFDFKYLLFLRKLLFRSQCLCYIVIKSRFYRIRWYQSIYLSSPVYFHFNNMCRY